MLHFSRKTAIMLTATMLLFCLTMMPLAIGYGSSEGGADRVGNGRYRETFDSGDRYAYYVIEANQGDALKIKITLPEHESYYFRAYLYCYYENAPSQDSTSATSVEPHEEISLTQNCEFFGDYIIRFSISSSEDDFTFTMDVSGSTALRSMFDINITTIAIFVGFVSAIIGVILVIVYVKKKKSSRSIQKPTEPSEIAPITEEITEDANSIGPMYCPGCGVQIKTTNKFCTKCGAALHNE